MRRISLPNPPRSRTGGEPRRSLGEDAGQAMVLVVTVMLALVLIAAAVVAAGLGELSLSAGAKNNHTALAAADAGVTDYVSRLRQDPNFWQNPSGDQAIGGWMAVPGPSSNGEYFTYTPNTSSTAATGKIDLTVTGRVGNATRTIRVVITKSSFLNYAYFSIYELPDPTDTNIYPSGKAATVQSHCVYDENQANPTISGGGVGPNWNWHNGNTYCQYLFWGTGNVVNGPAGSDGNFFICGNPQFNGPVTSASMTSDPSGGTYPGWLQTGSSSLGYASFPCPSGSNPTFNGVPASQGGNVTPGPYLGMPATDSQLVQYAQANGCYYTGATSVTFNAPPSPSQPGTMTVSSPNSTIGTAPGQTNPACVGTNVALPPNGVIYVANATSSQGCQAPSNPSGQQWQSNTADGSGSNCQGNLFEQGVVGGQVTTAAANNVFITGSLCNPTDSNCVAGNTDPGNTVLTGNDVLGIVAQNFVYLYGPPCAKGVGSANSDGKDCQRPTNVTVDGAILDINHAVSVERLSQAPAMGQFAVNGSLIGRFSPLTGLVNQNGVVKKGYATTVNTYDSRLRALSPPHFLDPVGAGWNATKFGEVPNPSTLPAMP